MTDDLDPSGSRGRVLPVLALLGAAAAGFGLYRLAMFRRRWAAEVRNAPPVDPEVAAHEFAGVPLHPGAELDPVATAQVRHSWTIMAGWMRRVEGVLERVLPGPAANHWVSPRSAVYTVQAPPAEVASWYDEALPLEGWGPRPRAPSRWPHARGTAYRTRQYSKAGHTLWVIVSPADGVGSTRLDLSKTSRRDVAADQAGQ